MQNSVFKQTIWVKIVYFIIIFQLFSFPFHRVSSTIPSMLFILFSIIYLYKNNIAIFSVFKESLFLQLTTVYFLISLFGFFQEDQLSEFVNKGKLKIFFAIIPLMLFSVKDIIRHYYISIIKTIILSGIFSILFFIIIAVFRYSEFGTSAFLYLELVSISYINPIILSIVYNAIILFIYYTPIVKKQKNKHLLIILFGIFIIMLLSKAGIIIFLFSYLFILYDSFKSNKIVFIGVLAVFLLSIFFFLKTQDGKIISTRINVFNYYLKNWNSTNYDKKFPRLAILQSSETIIKNNLLIGVGVSNTNDVLYKEFKRVGFNKGIKHNYNTHNQFLETLLASGLFGLLSLFAMFFYLLKQGFQQKNKLLIHFTLVIIAACLIESFFESQMSVFLFLLYSSIILIGSPLISSRQPAYQKNK